MTGSEGLITRNKSANSAFERSDEERLRLTNLFAVDVGTIRVSRLRASRKTKRQSSGASFIPCQVTCRAMSKASPRTGYSGPACAWGP